MKKSFVIPWEKLYDYTMECGQQHDPYKFVVAALEEMSDLVPYDQAIAYCLDESRKVVAQHLINVKSRWSTMYLEYYSHLNSTPRKLSNTAEEMFGIPYVIQINWTAQPETEFITNYIMARGVKCSLAFALFDLNGLVRATLSFDRTRSERFSESEMAIARLAGAQIGNMFKNFFVNTDNIPGQNKQILNVSSTAALTKREHEVVELLCQGLSPAHIAKTLHISVSTAYKHIAHIYKKLNVSSQQELLVRILGSGSR